MIKKKPEIKVHKHVPSKDAFKPTPAPVKYVQASSLLLLTKVIEEIAVELQNRQVTGHDFTELIQKNLNDIKKMAL